MRLTEAAVADVNRRVGRVGLVPRCTIVVACERGEHACAVARGLPAQPEGWRRWQFDVEQDAPTLAGANTNQRPPITTISPTTNATTRKFLKEAGEPSPQRRARFACQCQ